MSKLTHEQRGPIHIIFLSGEIKLSYVIPKIKELATEIIEIKKEPLIIDLSDSIMVDSAFLSFLLNCDQKLKRINHRLRIVSNVPSVDMVFTLSDTDTYFQLYKSLAEAMKAVCDNMTANQD